MSFFLPRLTSKQDIDQVITSVKDLVVVLRFGREDDHVCLQLDDILEKTAPDLAKMASIHLVDVDKVPVYLQYFDITLIPATVFFFNAQHMKVDWGTPDHTKFIGSFRTKQDFIDVVETIFRGAMKGKVMFCGTGELRWLASNLHGLSGPRGDSSRTVGLWEMVNTSAYINRTSANLTLDLRRSRSPRGHLASEANL